MGRRSPLFLLGDDDSAAWLLATSVKLARLCSPFMKKPTTLLFVLALSSTAAFAADDKPSPIGYSDTPIIPGTQWKVHDIDRPRPEAVKPADKLGQPPADAIILFDGKNADAFVSKKLDEKGKPTKEMIPCVWKIDNGELVVEGGDSWTKESFASCQYHIEWKSEPHTKGNSQKKGNSGTFFIRPCAIAGMAKSGLGMTQIGVR